MHPFGTAVRSATELTGIFRIEIRGRRMTLLRLLAGAAAIGALAAPAAAQYYPQPAYPPQQYPQGYPPQAYPGYGQNYGNQQGYTGNPVTDVIDQLLGNRYNVTDRQAIRQCASAARAQAGQYGNGYGGYNGYNNNGYNRGYGAMRVTAITGVERRSNGLRVSGLMGSGGYGNQGYGYGNRGYGGQLSFRCNVDYRGAVTGLRVRPAG
jgi:hypothetical protein